MKKIRATRVGEKMVYCDSCQKKVLAWECEFEGVLVPKYSANSPDGNIYKNFIVVVAVLVLKTLCRQTNTSISSTTVHIGTANME